jgi:hypothetical protein
MGFKRRLAEAGTAAARSWFLSAGTREGAMPDERTEIATEAAAKALHEAKRQATQLPWDQCSEESRQDVRAFVRPIVEAALMASDAYMAAAATILPTPKV